MSDKQEALFELCKDFSSALKKDGVIIGEKVIADLLYKTIDKYPADRDLPIHEIIFVHFAEWIDAIGEAIGKDVRNNIFAGDWMDDMPAVSEFISNAVVSNTLLLQGAANTYEEIYGHSLLDVFITMANDECSAEEASIKLSKMNTIH